MVERAIGCDVSPEDSNFGQHAPLDAVEKTRALGDDMRLIDVKDWSKSIPHWPVGDQGTFGSCVGWAVARGLAHWYLVRKGALSGSELLSPNFVWLIARHRPAAFSPSFPPPPIDMRLGTNYEHAFMVASMLGLMKEPIPDQVWEQPPLPPGDHASQLVSLPQNKIVRLLRDKFIWAEWIRTSGPFVVRIEMDRAFEANNDETLKKYAGRTGRGHAVTIVGTERNPEDAKDINFLIRNSWGAENWGESGVKRATSGYLLAATTEAWGILP